MGSAYRGHFNFVLQVTRDFGHNPFCLNSTLLNLDCLSNEMIHNNFSLFYHFTTSVIFEIALVIGNQCFDCRSKDDVKYFCLTLTKYSSSKTFSL